ncbi:S-phase kinase-associated protein 1 [Dermacentor silvarum]|uniref:S-phase kinase-associated protein 1 n=1 Tax=Dermacentor silvarum TaxID=543639 RepID=UPI002101D4CE|nr:S-phase kinase-associated protein 1 [Dermacentor silvarum]
MESGRDVHDSPITPAPDAAGEEVVDTWQMAGASPSANSIAGIDISTASPVPQQTLATSPAPSTSTMKLQSSEGQVFEVDLQTAMVSGTLRTMMEDLGKMNTDADEVVPLVNVNTATLKKVLQWATYHKDDWLLLAEDDAAIGARQPLSSWDAEFFNVDQATLFQLIVAADYLDIKGLMNSACRTVAGMIRAKTTDDMRKRLCIRNNFTPSEEQLVKRETEWYD